MQTSKILADIDDCISELKKEFLALKTPITDDSVVLHKFEGKIELVLQTGFKEEPGLLGQRNTYWEYFCSCFSSFKRKHEGILFVKSLTKLKTSLGRGRAFIRFCLMQKCLADSLQICFTNGKITRDFYCEKSIACQEKLWTYFVSSLYDVNEINFDLPSFHELDISWPTFARKVFSSPSNKMSCHVPSTCDPSLQGVVEDCQVIKQNSELSHENHCLRQELQVLHKNRYSLEKYVSDLLKDYQYLQHVLCSTCKETVKEGSKLGNVKFDSPEICKQLQSFSKNCSLYCDERSIPNDNNIVSSKEDYFEDSSSLFNDKFEHLNSKRTDGIVCASCDIPFIKVNESKENLSGFNPCSGSEAYVLDEKRHSHSDDLNDICDNKNSLVSNEHLVSQTFQCSHITKSLKKMETLMKDLEKAVEASDVNLAKTSLTGLKTLLSDFEVINSANNKFSADCPVENNISSITGFAHKQDSLINLIEEQVELSLSGHQNLYSQIVILKGLLQTYGFKITEEKSVLQEIPKTDAESSDRELCDTSNDSLSISVHPVISSFQASLSKLHVLNSKLANLLVVQHSSLILSKNLVDNIKDQEMHLKGVTKELEEAQCIVSVIKEQHKKLQSSEGILKYDLQEKRKLLTKLKQQLENTREDLNIARLKNSKSEVEWQSLRKEFRSRHKQTSEESGFIDYKGLDDQGDETLTPEYSFVEQRDESPLCDNLNVVSSEEPAKKSRLELLEEQCKILHSNLLQNSRKRQEIDNRLESICKGLEKSANRNIHNRKVTHIQCDVHHDEKSDSLILSSGEEEINDSTCGEISESFHLPSDGENLNFEISAYLPEDIDFSELLSNSEHVLTFENQTCPETSSGNSSSEVPVDRADLCAKDSLTHFDSLMMKKKDLEDTLKALGFQEECSISSDTRTLKNEIFLKTQISELQKENKFLQDKISELEQKNAVLSTELDQKSQQLILSRVSKGHEIAALQFQLNTEAIKYERALKEFSVQNSGLESMKQKINDQEELIIHLENALAEITEERESEKERQWLELQDIQSALDSREQEYMILYQELEQSAAFIEKEQSKSELLLTQLEELKSYSQRDKCTLENELLHLQNDSKELRKKLIKLLKEKDLLWKRNNYLSNIYKMKINERWLNDSEVSSCLSCHNSFTFLLRKHHCRFCGRIFCHACSNNWILTASSSKRIRACNSCYADYIQLKEDARKGSDIPCVEDDSEDEMFASHCFRSSNNSSFNSEASLFITGSISSLPLKEIESIKQSYMFSSAPELCSLSNQNKNSVLAQMRSMKYGMLKRERSDCDKQFTRFQSPRSCVSPKKRNSLDNSRISILHSTPVPVAKQNLNVKYESALNTCHNVPDVSC